MQPSVDLFLEKRPEYLEIGKAAIAAALIAYENPNSLGRKEDGLSWYEYLFAKLETSPEEFSQNKLAIITFNYDRSLEYFLFVALRHTYDLKENEAAKLVHSIPIIHVYGQLGAFPFLGLDNERYYTPEVKPELIKIAASGIRIISEDAADTPEFTQAHDLIAKAKVVCFLGFGFHTENVKRLITKVQQQLDTNWNFRTFDGSAYDIKEGERPLISHLFKGRIKLGNEDEDVLNYLRRNQIFLHRTD